MCFRVYSTRSVFRQPSFEPDLGQIVQHSNSQQNIQELEDLDDDSLLLSPLPVSGGYFLSKDICNLCVRR